MNLEYNKNIRLLASLNSTGFPVPSSNSMIDWSWSFGFSSTFWSFEHSYDPAYHAVITLLSSDNIVAQ